MTLQYLERADKPRLAFHKTEAKGKNTDKPTIVFLGGFRSDMEGTKATYLEDHCKENGLAYLRLDYSGHGQSGGEFLDGCIGDWADDAQAVIESHTDGSLILIGSSMGGWISFLLADRLKDRVNAMIGLAAAPDFTRDFMYKEFDDQMRKDLITHGFVDVPNDYSDDPYRITKKLIDDGENHCFLDKGLDITIPITLIQGKKDTDVEWQTAERIKNSLSDCDIKIVYLEDGDHRLSSPDELKVIVSELKQLL